MATSLFELTATLTLDVEDFVTKMKEAEQSGGNFQKEIEEADESAKKMIASAKNWASAVGASIGRFMTDAIKLAADYDMVQRRFAWIFGDSTDAAKASIEDLSESIGIHYDRLQDTASAFYAQFTGYGLTPEESISAMVTALSLTADAAMLSGMSIEDAGEKLADFLRGSNEAGEALKIFSNEEIRAAAAFDLYKRKWDELSSAEQQYVMLKIAHDAYESSGLLGYASENADAFSNSVANINAQWNRLKIAIGTPLLKAIEPALASFTNFIDNSGDTLEDFIASIGQLASALSDLAQAGITWLGQNPTAVNTALGWVKGLFGMNETPKTHTDADINQLAADYVKAYDAYYDAKRMRWIDQKNVDQNIVSGANQNAAYENLKRVDPSLASALYNILTPIGLYGAGEWRSINNEGGDLASMLASLPDNIRNAIMAAFPELTVNVSIDGASVGSAVDTEMGRNGARNRYTNPSFA